MERRIVVASIFAMAMATILLLVSILPASHDFGRHDSLMSQNRSFSISIGSHPDGVAVGDVDNDGRNEIVVTSMNPHRISVFSVPEWNEPVRTQSIGVLGPAAIIALGDMNGDNMTDVVTTNRGSPYASFEVILQNESGLLEWHSYYTLSTLPSSRAAAVGDVDDDPGIEVIVATEDGSPTYLHIYGWNGIDMFVQEGEYAISDNAVAIAVGDLSNDGRNDVPVSGWPSGDVHIFYQAANGSLQTDSPIEIFSDRYLEGICIADIDSDGLNDIVVSGAYSASISNVRQMLEGGFERPNHHYLVNRGYAEDVVVSDIDKNGAKEIIVANYYEGCLEIISLDSKGGGGNREHTLTFPAGDGPNELALGNLVGQDDIEIIVSNWHEGSLIVYDLEYSEEHHFPLHPILSLIIFTLVSSAMVFLVLRRRRPKRRGGQEDPDSLSGR